MNHPFGSSPPPLRPPKWALSGHSQTIFGHLWPSPVLQGVAERWEIPLADGDTLIGLAHIGNPDFVVCLFHGLGGSSDSDYMHRSVLTCQDLGVSAVRFNHRGCGPGEGLAKGPYHSGRGEDLSAALKFTRARFPNAFVLAIGFSLSGNALLLSLAGVRGEPVPDAAIAVNAPIDLADASRLMSVGLNRVYDFRFTRLCRKAVATRVRSGHLNNPPTLSVWSTLKEFDALYTAPEGGFASREEYYALCSAAPHVAKITTPTLILTADDDPFVASSHYRALNLPDNIRLHIETFGGHMGYLSSETMPLGTRRWMDFALRGWIQDCRDRSKLRV